MQILNNKHVVVVGLGLTGLSCVKFLLSKHANVTAMDTRLDLNVEVDDSVDVVLGKLDQEKLCSADLILLSPGLPLQLPEIQKAMVSGVEVIGDIELFARFNQKPVLAITGSNGKSTVTMLVDAIFKAAGKRASIGGNIGIPALELLTSDADFAVLELSSFQLETTSSLSPLVATVLNISDDHMDRYEDLEGYQQAKLNIYRGAKHVVSNRDDPMTYSEHSMKEDEFGLDKATLGFGYDAENKEILHNNEPMLNMSDCKLAGVHNVLNIQAAASICMLAGIETRHITQGIKNFTGLAHRCQLVSENNGVKWINDSKATNVGATIAAIQGLKPQVSGKMVLIAGGDGKGADFSPLQSEFEMHVDQLITLGKDGGKLSRLKQNSINVSTLEGAVETAANLVTEGDLVLLSPACASLDMFANYQQRGDVFIKAVEAIH